MAAAGAQSRAARAQVLGMRGRSDIAQAALISLAFVSPGAWMVTVLPPMHVAQSLQLATFAVWLAACGFGVVPVARLARLVSWALISVVGALALSWLLAGDLFQTAFYDLYGNMPLVQWLAFLGAFALAAGVRWTRAGTIGGLGVVLGFGTLLSAVMVFQQINTGQNHVFGSPAYGVTALAALVPVGIGLTVVLRSRARWFALAGGSAIAVAIGLRSGTTGGLLAAAFAAGAGLLVWPAIGRPTVAALKVARAGVAIGLSLAIAALLVLQVPALTGAWFSPRTAVSLDEGVLSRAYLWEGAQKMATARPILGYGPSGYRPHAVEYLAPEALQFGADLEGNADPTVYSPQSPHGLVWEIVTRLGLAGLAALLALAVCWAVVLASHARAEPDEFALRASLGAAFVTATFTLLVNPIVFPMGLFAPAAAGIAIASWRAAAGRTKAAAEPGLSPAMRWGFAGTAVAVAACALWLGAGGARMAAVSADSAVRAQQDLREVRRVFPAHPVVERRLLELSLLLAADAGQVSAAQAGVDAAPGYVTGFAPNLVNLAMYSLAQADRTGRADVAWETRLLGTADERLPLLPSLAAEKLHAALSAKDADAVAAALPDAEKWGGPYPYTAAYIDRARSLGSEGAQP